MPHKNLTLGNGMNKADLLKGFLLGIIGSILVVYTFITLFTPYNFVIGIQIMKSHGSLSKLITLGAILDLTVFIISLKLNKDFIAGGAIIAAISLILLTLFI
jgi:hypothetical protein